MKTTTCAHCGATLETVEINTGINTIYQPKPCSCEGATAARQLWEDTQVELKATKLALALGRTGIPLETVERVGMEVTEDMLAPLREGRGYLFCGGIGRGKTTTAASIAKAWFLDGIMWCGDTYVSKNPVMFATTVQLMSKIKENMADGVPGTMMDRCCNVSLLVIDDLGKEEPTPWVVSTEWDIIDRRYSNHLPTIITTQYTQQELMERMGSRGADESTYVAMLSRVIDMCEVRLLNGDNLRNVKKRH